ncbi:MFS transporter [cf. Phormidesmis sp. LEGE 11477]|uniref:MFS transporter n=1 Tax=cf. Phormidesmis sp. LEGE 11477 TaxID=1828680 RepID=UPI00187F3C07|nr:MFS transporter [cf. Phormidesmis sp. LEGE 11477]MBE9062580.1 MFS transporter [cf. Phormidesmis sp. LEGE 11477]
MSFSESLLLAKDIWPKDIFHTVNFLAQTSPDAVAIPVPVEVPAAPVIAGPQFFIALLSGVILAFGFQLLLTNLSMAAGVSYVAHSSNSSSSNDSGSSSSSGGSGIKKIGIAFGAWTLITVCIALFFACWLAISLTAYINPLLGAITGLVIWATYFTLLLWFSSTAVGSLVGSMVKSATSGFGTIMGTATAALGAKSASNQVVQTAEAAAAAIRRELATGLDISGIQDTLQDYLSTLKSAEVDVSSVEQEFERLIKEAGLSGIDRDSLPTVNKKTFVDLLSDRTDLSREEANRTADRLYRIWQKNTDSTEGLNDLVKVVATATGGQLASKGLGKELSALVSELRQQNKNSQDSSDQKQDSGSSAMPHVMSMGMSMLSSTILGKSDLSDMDASKLISEIKAAKDRVSSGGSLLPAPTKEALPFYDTLVQADVENYIQHAYIGELKSPELNESFRNVIYDAEAEPAEVRKQLSNLGRDLFSKCLQERGLLTQGEIRDIATRMEIIRQAVIKEITAAEVAAAEQNFRQYVETFFKYTPASELTSEMGDEAFRSIIESENLDAAHLRETLSQFNAEYFRQFLVTRDDVPAHELSEHYEKLLEKVIADAEGVDKAAKVRLQQQQQSLEDYLRNTGKDELNPDGIKRDIQTLLNEPNEGVRRVRSRLSSMNRDTLVALLKQRPEFAEDEIDYVLDTVESAWRSVVNAPQKLNAKSQQQSDEADNAITTYLRNTGKPELSPEGIKRDLQKLMNHPKAGARAIRYRLSKMDRDTLVQLLNQRDDLSEQEINQTIDSLLNNIQNIIKSPRRLARRTQGGAKSKALSFQGALEDYLTNTNKDELHPEGIKRDLKLLLNDPKLGASKLGDRINQMDDSTMVALLAQRPDMTQAEAEAAVGRIVKVRHQIKDQIRSVQSAIQSTIDSIFARIRTFLQSLDRPELDYYSIKRDVRAIMDDPQSGFDVVRGRLSQFDRDTLVALVSANNRVSKSDANRVIDQIESTRDGVLRKAEEIERQFESRINSIKAQTQQQMEDTKAAAEAAAWWLFGTALLSAIVAALGGFLAVA